MAFCTNCGTQAVYERYRCPFLREYDRNMRELVSAV